MRKNIIIRFASLLTLAAAFTAHAQYCYFTILAGQTNAIGTNDGIGSGALFNHPHGLAVDAAGNVYVADSYNGSIRLVTPQSNVTTLTFECQAVTAIPNTPAVISTNQPFPPPTIVFEPFSFTAPQSLMVDTNANLFVSDNNIIYKVQLNPDVSASVQGQFVVTLFAGAFDPSPPFTGQVGILFNHPCGMALDQNTNLYLADQYNQVVREVSPFGTVTTLGGQLGNPDLEYGAGTNAAFYFPYGIAVGQSNTMFVSDGLGIRKITQTNLVGMFWFHSGAGLLPLATDAAGYVYTAGRLDGTNCVIKIAPDTTNVTIVGVLPTNATISGIALDAGTNIYLADQQNSVILKSTPYPPFFNGQTSLGNGNFYLAFTNGTPFGYYNLGSFNFPLFYHSDLGFEYFFDANDGQGDAYLYDFASSTFWYTGPTLFPYMYDFSLNDWLYYYPNTSQPGHYTTNPRSFYDFGTGKTITK